MQTAAAGPRGAVARLGLAEGQIVQEIGYDEDVDHELRDAAEAVVGSPLEDDGYDGGADVVLLWWRDGDGDLTDDLVDALAHLVDGGTLALLTPRAREDGAVDPADLEDAASTAGLRPSGQINVAPEWFGTRLVPAGAPRRN